MERSTMNDLPQHVRDERNGLDYALHGDYYLPDLELPKEQCSIGRWVRMRPAYLKKHRPGLYTRLILSGKLDSHLADVDEQAETRVDTVIDGYKRQMRWVQIMNLARAEAEQSVLEGIMYL